MDNGQATFRLGKKVNGIGDVVTVRGSEIVSHNTKEPSVEAGETPIFKRYKLANGKTVDVTKPLQESELWGLVTTLAKDNKNAKTVLSQVKQAFSNVREVTTEKVLDFLFKHNDAKALKGKLDYKNVYRRLY